MKDTDPEPYTFKLQTFFFFLIAVLKAFGSVPARAPQ